MYQTAIRELADKYSIFVTPEMLEDMNSVLTAAVPIDDAVAELRTTNTSLAAELAAIVEVRERELRTRAEVEQARNNALDRVSNVRERVHDFVKEMVDDYDYDRGDANTFLESVGAGLLVSSWSTDVDWGYSTIGSATVQAVTQEQADELASENYEVVGATVNLEFQFNDTDEVVWESSTGDHEFDWDGEASDYIEIDSTEDN